MCALRMRMRVRVRGVQARPCSKAGARGLDVPVPGCRSDDQSGTLGGCTAPASDKRVLACLRSGGRGRALPQHMRRPENDGPYRVHDGSNSCFSEVEAALLTPDADGDTHKPAPGAVVGAGDGFLDRWGLGMCDCTVPM